MARPRPLVVLEIDADRSSGQGDPISVGATAFHQSDLAIQALDIWTDSNKSMLAGR